MTDLLSLTHEDWQPRVGETFTATGEEGSRDLELTEVEVLTGPDDGKRRPFSLLFLDRSEAEHLPQQIVELGHSGMETLSLFVVPLGPIADGMRYQAVFN